MLRKIILVSVSITTISVLLNFIFWNYFTNKWLAVLFNTILLFALIFISGIYLKKFFEQNIIDAVYQKIKNLLPNNEHKKMIIDQNNLILLIDKIWEEKRKEQEKFKQLDSYRKEYLGNVSHELKTPLFNVQGYIATLLDGAYEDTNILIEYLTKADKNIERMRNIIDDLETISQLESGVMILDYEVFDIAILINEVYEQMELSAQNKSIKLKLNKKQDEYYLVNADKFRIRQVLLNLVSNSIKYGKQGGTTTTTLEKQDEKIIIHISDDGIGIEEKHLPRIFERFYRVDKGRSREQGGTGLGLAIVKHIIEAHKQTISVKSTPNKGTTFTFSLESK